MKAALCASMLTCVTAAPVNAAEFTLDFTSDLVALPFKVYDPFDATYDPMYTIKGFGVSQGAYTTLFNNRGLAVYSEGTGIEISVLNGAVFDLKGFTLAKSDYSSNPITLSYFTADGLTGSLRYAQPGTGMVTYSPNLPNLKSVRFTIGIGDFRLVSLAGAIPEPSTWAMMLAGFGLVGYSLRRRRAVVAFA